MLPFYSAVGADAALVTVVSVCADLIYCVWGGSDPFIMLWVLMLPFYAAVGMGDALYTAS